MKFDINKQIKALARLQKYGCAGVQCHECPISSSKILCKAVLSHNQETIEDPEPTAFLHPLFKGGGLT